MISWLLSGPISCTVHSSVGVADDISHMTGVEIWNLGDGALFLNSGRLNTEHAEMESY